MTDQEVGVLALGTGPVSRCYRVDIGDSAWDALYLQGVDRQGVAAWLSA